MIIISKTINQLLEVKLPKQTSNFFTSLAIIGFTVHLICIYLANNGFGDNIILSKFGKNYLESIYTPFSFILFYEVLLLIFSIPRSLTTSVRIQFEIISLITIRNVFKDLAQLDHVGNDMSIEVLYKVFIDMGSGIVMFFLVALYARLARKLRDIKDSPESKRLQLYIKSKRIVAISLACLLMFFTIFTISDFIQDVYQVINLGLKSKINYKTIFYEDLFSAMIFTDVFLLLLSMYYTSSYKFLIRNAGFVVSTVLIRLSMSLEQPLNSLVAISAMVCGCSVLAIYFLFHEEKPSSASLEF